MCVKLANANEFQKKKGSAELASAAGLDVKTQESEEQRGDNWVQGNMDPVMMGIRVKLGNTTGRLVYKNRTLSRAPKKYFIGAWDYIKKQRRNKLHKTNCLQGLYTYPPLTFKLQEHSSAPSQPPFARRVLD